MADGTALRARARPSRLLRWWWVLVGALLGFGIIGILTIGWMLLLMALSMTVVGVFVPLIRHSSPALLLLGLAVAPMTVAWLNREGPGTVCATTGSQLTCVEQWSPWQFLAGGLLLAVLGVLLAGRHRRGPRRGDETRTDRSPASPPPDDHRPNRR